MRARGMWAFAALVVVLGTLACNDDPLAEGRDTTTRFLLNPTFANVLVGDTTQVTAIPVNSNGEPTGDAVTGTACDNKITVTPDPERVAFEPPERYLVVGVTAGESCVNVSAGGVEATVTINVVAPAS